MKPSYFLAALLVAAVLGVSESSTRADDAPYILTIKDHRFQPTELTIPANTKVKLVIKNLDPTPEEFESHELHREKIVTGRGEAVIFLGPLDPGTYKFFGDFHEDTAQGRLIAK